MISNEVLAFFKVTDEDELEDAFELLFFEHKQFFLNKVPVKKLVEARISKLEKAGLVYSGYLKRQENDVQVEPFIYDFSVENLLDLFQAFQIAKTHFYLRFQQATSVKEFVAHVRAFTEMYYTYASNFQGVFELDESLRVSVENDPMMILNGIKEYESKGGLTLNQLKNFENEPPEILIHEMKRLSLLFNSF